MTSWSKIRWLIGATMGILAANHARADVRVVGTDLLGLDFTKAFYEFAGRKGVRLTLALDGSRPGLAELKSDRADLALVLLPPAELALVDAFETRPLGFQRVMVAVPAACPVEQISFDELALIFGPADGPRASMHWSDLGLTGEWGKKPVTPFAPQGALAIGADFFRQAVLNERPFNASVRRYATMRELADEFPRNSIALALIPAVPPGVAATMKVIPVAKSRGRPAVVAGGETLYSGEYPLRLPLQVIFRPDRRAALQILFEFLWSAEAARELERADVVPLPPLTRESVLQIVQSTDRSVP